MTARARVNQVSRLLLSSFGERAVDDACDAGVGHLIREPGKRGWILILIPSCLRRLLRAWRWSGCLRFLMMSARDCFEDALLQIFIHHRRLELVRLTPIVKNVFRSRERESHRLILILDDVCEIV